MAEAAPLPAEPVHQAVPPGVPGSDLEGTGLLHVLVLVFLEGGWTDASNIIQRIM